VTILSGTPVRYALYLLSVSSSEYNQESKVNRLFLLSISTVKEEEEGRQRLPLAQNNLSDFSPLLVYALQIQFLVLAVAFVHWYSLFSKKINKLHFWLLALSPPMNFKG
jgi:hypothetical protein